MSNTTTMSVRPSAYAPDLERGFDVMRGSAVLAHFATWAEAVAYAAQGRDRYVRYWRAK